MDVFISYRRDGGYAMARLVYECMRNVGLSVFLDLEELRSGQFNEKLYKEIENCKNFVLILPPNSLDRCDSEEDWLRLEIEHAIKLKKNIIPVMMVGFEFPGQLPPSLQVLPFFNGVKSSREYFDAAIKKVISLLQGVELDESKLNLSERHDDVRYYYDEDEQEKHRLRTEDALLARYEKPIVEKLLDGKKNVVCLDVNVLSTTGSFARLTYPEITNVIALTYSEEIAKRGNAEKADLDTGEQIDFFQVQFEADDFEARLEKCLDAAGVDGIDLVYLSMAIMDFKKPFKVLQAIQNYLNDDAVMLVRDVDDGAVFAYPDKNGLFSKFQSYYIHNVYSGYRYTGRQVYSYVRKMEPREIVLERYGVNTSSMSRKDKKALFECWFSFIPNDFARMLRENPESKIAKEVVEFCDKHYDELNEQFFSRDLLFSAGYIIYSVKF
ncbi:MAG: toll/interleukin-1 receptor domain-containing protein [Oscillospiraceae bacterium]|nr:toll/interleukin-1 receptor domain-containing protein [Oscillospiraceae bacterium]